MAQILTKLPSTADLFPQPVFLFAADTACQSPFDYFVEATAITKDFAENSHSLKRVWRFFPLK